MMSLVQEPTLSCIPHVESARSRVGKWLEAVPHLSPHHGGLSSVVPQLSANLSGSQGFTIELADFEKATDISLTAGKVSVPISKWSVSRLNLLHISKEDAFSKKLNDFDGVHIHGLWTSHVGFAAHAAQNARKPYIISAHGMLEKWALAQKAWKKTIYSALVERKNLAGAACLHALTQAEAEDYRRFGCKGPIAIIPNGVNTPLHTSLATFTDKFPELRGKRIILFLGRLHPKKGVELLLRAWKHIEEEFADAALVLAGPQVSEEEFKRLRAIASHGKRIVFTGMLDASLKWSALAAARGFVLPSHSEGLSVAVLEALSSACPVIISKSCNMPEVTGVGAGWCIEPDLALLVDALRELLSNTSEANAQIGRRARHLFETRYSWPIVAAQFAELYTWVQGGPAPTSFELQREVQ